MADIRRIRIWSGWLRLSHLLVGGSVLVLMVTGWLRSHTPSVEAEAVDVHYYAASILIAGLVLRIWLMFAGRPVERIGQLVPEDDEWPAVGQMLRFYVSFGKTPLPRWYAHNPLWKPLYLLLYVCLLVLALSGALQSNGPLLFGVYLPDIHAVFAAAVWILVIAHMVTAVLHDLKGESDDVSGIINGHRLFVVDKPTLEPSGIEETVVRLDQIVRPPKQPED